MTSLTDLPPEVIQTIIRHLPPEAWKVLVDIPKIGKLILNSLPGIIIDHNPKFEVWSGPNIYHNFLNMYCSEYLRLLASNPGLVPKKLVFLYPLDVIPVLNNTNLRSDSTKIDIIFPADRVEDNKRFICEYILNPFAIDSGYLNPVPDAEYYSAWYGIQTEYNVEEILGLKLGRGFNVLFPSVTCLSINDELKVADLKLLPRQLKVLTCRVKTIRTLVKFDLPPDLEELSIAVSASKPSAIPTVTISHLSRLQKLTLRTYLGPAYTKWDLPSSLQVLHVDLFEVIPENLSDVCPQLRELKIKDSDKTPRVALTEALKVPETLRHLEVPSSFLALDSDNVESDPAARSRLQLPPGLTELYVNNNALETRLATLDCERNDLAQLKSLTIVEMQNFKLLGDLPSGLESLMLHSLTSALFNGPAVFHLNQLVQSDSLKNIKNLELYSLCSDEELSCRFPSSLERLVIRKCGLTKVNIEAANLRSLDLAMNAFDVLDDDIFLIPSTVRQLSLKLNFMTAVSTKFPDGLEYLDLSENRLDHIDGLPDSLKTLRLEQNFLGKSEIESVFPVGLERLSIAGNFQLKSEWFKRLNLPECTRLKHLAATICTLPTFNLEYMPSSLLLLDLRGCGITSFTGGFKNLDNLECLYLSENSLRGYFKDFGKYRGPMFGPNIRTVDVECCDLTKPDVTALMQHLSNSPHFECLNVETTLLPKAIDPDDLRPVKMRRIGA
ncbi:hypothetical protein Cantr_06667 [Candida viswanathii]|uniref:Uncharacterized protein n=1 Tax=Candida viswanathii TaxID=5486 RepID=A0A367XXD1_9ASCO|nr:hypothetical protein Cantr_06667 [Candida viswanathii]